MENCEAVPVLVEQNTLEDGNKSCGMSPLVLSADGRLKRQFVISEVVFCASAAAAGVRATAAGETTTQGDDANVVS